MKLSFQLYSAREHGPWDSVFERLAAIGYDTVEGYSALYDDAEALARQLAAHALSMPSGHFALETLEEDLGGAVATARTLGCETLYAPHLAAELRPTDTAGWVAFARRLAEVGRRLADEGLAFGWHNHDFELVPTADGTVPLDVILEEAPEIGWEADLAWVVRAGADPAAWVAHRAPRITAVHLKDVAPSGECADEDGWADPGTGTIDWPALAATLASDDIERLWIAEHDRPSDLERFARRAFDAFGGYAAAAAR